MNKLILGVAIVALLAGQSRAVLVTLDDFNTDEGHFNQLPTFSSSTTNLISSITTPNTPISTADRVTTLSFEGAGNEQIVANFITQGATSRIRFLSGTGTPANNTNFATTSGTDGWIGLAVKTTSPGWNVQLWMEPGSSSPATGSNGGIPKNVASDGEWHIYEWNLDDNSGGSDGWGTISGIATGVATVGNGNHTIDSIVFRNSAPTGASNTIFMDFVAISTVGRLSDALAPVPEAGSFAAVGLIGLISIGGAWIRRRKSQESA